MTGFDSRKLEPLDDYRTAIRVRVSLGGSKTFVAMSRIVGKVLQLGWIAASCAEDPRWTVVYHLYNLSNHTHLRLKTDVSEEKSELPSVIGVWRTADWHEREAYDMMGLRFRGHLDLRRILMWEGYPYFPLRKDFPVTGSRV